MVRTNSCEVHDCKNYLLGLYIMWLKEGWNHITLPFISNLNLQYFASSCYKFLYKEIEGCLLQLRGQGKSRKGVYHGATSKARQSWQREKKLYGNENDKLSGMLSVRRCSSERRTPFGGNFAEGDLKGAQAGARPMKRHCNWNAIRKPKGAQAGARPMRRSPTGQRNAPNESKVPFLFPRMDVLTLNIWLWYPIDQLEGRFPVLLMEK